MSPMCLLVIILDYIEGTWINSNDHSIFHILGAYSILPGSPSWHSVLYLFIDTKMRVDYWHSWVNKAQWAGISQGGTRDKQRFLSALQKKTFLNSFFMNFSNFGNKFYTQFLKDRRLRFIYVQSTLVYCNIKTCFFVLVLILSLFLSLFQ